MTRFFSRVRQLSLVAGMIAVASVLSAWAGRSPHSVPVVVTLRPDVQYQTIRSFGASDAWAVQFLGEYWPVEQRARAADLLFSNEERRDGSPLGIGLSAYRFEIGAGSATPSDSSKITDRWRRATGFLKPDGTYDWNQQRGQRAFMREAKARGVETFIGFVNSPPVAFTRNGRATSSGGDSANLDPSRYRDFARYLRDVVVELKKRDGVTLGILSPFNEPQWDWTGGQEGSPWRVDEMAAMTRVLSTTLSESRLDTKISIGESGRMNYVYERGDKPTRGEQLQAWFGRGSPHYIGSLPNVIHAIGAHSYHTTNPRDTLRSVRKRLHDAIVAVDPTLEFWQTEYCILETTPKIRGRGRDPGIDAALYIAGIIHSDLVHAHASTWHWWLSVTPYDYKDGLIYMDRDSLTGTVRDSKMLWALGHYSRFVRPGMRRIDVDVAGASADSVDAELMVSAYRDPRSGRVVTVLINRATEDRDVRLIAPGVGNVRAYRTTPEAGMDLKFSGSMRAAQPFVIPARSMMTLVSH